MPHYSGDERRWEAAAHFSPAPCRAAASVANGSRASRTLSLVPPPVARDRSAQARPSAGRSAERTRGSTATGVPALTVNMVGAADGLGGISRYTQELAARLERRVVYRHCEVTGGVSLLRSFPLVVNGLDPAAPLHFSQIVGAGVAIFRQLPPSVVTVHDLGLLLWPAEREMFSPIDRVYLHLSFSALRHVDRLIAISAYTEDSLVHCLGVPRERIVRVTQGVDHGVFWPRPTARPEVAARWGLRDWQEWKTLLVVGSELPRKNLGTLLRLIARYRNQGQQVRLIKVGAAGGARWRAATLRLITRLGIADRVHILENVPDEQLALLYSAADAYACPSLLEGQSLPTVEAMACGAPTVVAGAAALPETVSDAGLVVAQPEDPGAWKSVLDPLFDDPDLNARLRRQAVIRAAAFDWQRTAEGTLAVYAELALAGPKR
jgi:glycosyltransferase involved in cell wall biosynthesis